MPSWLVVLIVLLAFVAIIGCVQIVVGARDANLTTDLDSQRKVEINDPDKGKGSVTTTTTTTDTSTTTQEQKKK